MRIVIIGGGPGGNVAAAKAAKLGADVILIEKNLMGGTCSNRGCIPSKFFLAQAKIINLNRWAQKCGLDINIDLSGCLNIKKLVVEKNLMIGKISKGIGSYVEGLGVRIIKGEASFLNKNEVVIKTKSREEEKISGDKFIIATGSEPAMIPSFNIDGEKIITSTEALNMEEIPSRIIIIGSGPVGAEFATIFNAMGSKVILIESAQHMLPAEDPDVAAVLHSVFINKGIEILIGMKVNAIKREGDIVRVETGEKVIEGDYALIGIGRELNTKNIGIENIGVETERDAVVVNDHMQTNIPHIYAAGDITRKIMLANVAAMQGEVAAEHALGNEEARMQYHAVPYCIFTSPEIARVGISSKEAESKGIEVNVSIENFIGNVKAKIEDETDGFVKLVCEKKSGRILGASIVGSHAAEMIHELSLAVQHGLTSKELSRVIHIHPALSESIQEAAYSLA